MGIANGKDPGSTGLAGSASYNSEFKVGELAMPVESAFFKSLNLTENVSLTLNFIVDLQSFSAFVTLKGKYYTPLELSKSKDFKYDTNILLRVINTSLTEKIQLSGVSTTDPTIVTIVNVSIPKVAYLNIISTPVNSDINDAILSSSLVPEDLTQIAPGVKKLQNAESQWDERKSNVRRSVFNANAVASPFVDIFELDASEIKTRAMDDSKEELTPYEGLNNSLVTRFFQYDNFTKETRPTALLQKTAGIDTSFKGDEVEIESHYADKVMEKTDAMFKHDSLRALKNNSQSSILGIPTPIEEKNKTLIGSDQVKLNKEPIETKKTDIQNVESSTPFGNFLGNSSLQTSPASLSPVASIKNESFEHHGVVETVEEQKAEYPTFNFSNVNILDTNIGDSLNRENDQNQGMPSVSFETLNMQSTNIMNSVSYDLKNKELETNSTIKSGVTTFSASNKTEESNKLLTSNKLTVLSVSKEDQSIPAETLNKLTTTKAKPVFSLDFSGNISSYEKEKAIFSTSNDSEISTKSLSREKIIAFSVTGGALIIGGGFTIIYYYRKRVIQKRLDTVKKTLYPSIRDEEEFYS
jgi:hypothetical protein